LNGALTDKDLRGALEAVLKLFESQVAPDKRTDFRRQMDDALDKLPANGTATSSYLQAQLILATMAFGSLKEEVTEFYKAENKIQEGKAAAYTEGLRDANAALTEIKGSLQEIDGTTRSTGGVVKESKEKLDAVAIDVASLKPDSGN
jgi:hypothetical protein